MAEDVKIKWAVWTSPKTGLLAFASDWKNDDLPELYFGEDRLPVKNLRPEDPLNFARMSGYWIDKREIIFVLPEKTAKEEKAALKEGVYVAGSFNDWAKAVGDEAWKLQKDEETGLYCLRAPIKAIGGARKNQSFKFVTAKERWLEVPVDLPNCIVDDYGNRNFHLEPRCTGAHEFVFEPPLPFHVAADIQLIFRRGRKDVAVTMKPGPFVKKMASKLPLGAVVEDGVTIFRLFSPQANRVSVHIYKDPEATRVKTIAMVLRESCVWEARLPRNAHGEFYHFTVDGFAADVGTLFDPHFRVLDPYALAVAGPRGPAIVVDRARWKLPIRRFQPPAWQELIVLETHVRDLVARAPIDLTAEERMGFVGVTKWLKTEGSYLRSLGINAVELQPIQAFDTANFEDYGWGYMPVNYFSPAPQYCSDPRSPDKAAEEFKEMVEAFHEAGLAVILDVVYNHVGEPNHLQYVDRGYYFLLNADGAYLNFSGCGNTLDADTPMVRRLIVDSLVHLIEYFDVDGFRFDLGELIGVDTLVHVERALKAVKPSVIFIAEPWSFRGHIIRELKDTGIASWNDGYREFLKKYMRGEGGADGLFYFLSGSRDSFRFPAQTVNYVESHDDRCWIDEITENGNGSGLFPTANDRRRTHIMFAILMMSHGIPMLLAGIDFLKSKNGKRNTYLDGEENALPYERALQFPHTRDYLNKWMAFRLGLGKTLLCPAHPVEQGFFSNTVARNAIAVLYNANASLGSRRWLFAVNPHFEKVALPLPEGDLIVGKQIADHERFELAGLTSTTIPLAPTAHLRMPPLSCGLWQVHQA